jgi:hypothetical protein
VTAPTDRVLRQILKLLTLGDARRNTSEAEAMAAITKAKQLMVQYAVDPATVQQALDAQSGRGPRIIVDQYTAYTRKIRNLARYDEIIAVAVGALTATEPLTTHTRNSSGAWYTSMTFVGIPAHAQMAGDIFLILLKEVRSRTWATMGKRWGMDHTSYALGYAVRLRDRAKAMTDIPAAQAQSYALVVQQVQSAISEWKQSIKVSTKKRKGVTVSSRAYDMGYRDGGSTELNFNAKIKE